MSKKLERLMDGQGRVLLPSHIRKYLDLREGSVLEIDLTDDGIITITPGETRCSICGKSLDGKPRIELKNKKLICADCAIEISSTKPKGGNHHGNN